MKYAPLFLLQITIHLSAQIVCLFVFLPKTDTHVQLHTYGKVAPCVAELWPIFFQATI